jgi:energy-coupling factor transporter ATP-binding protein EcfA2
VLVMDEPTEGLAPLLVQQVAATLKQLAHATSEGTGIAVLLIEQNIGVAVEAADRIAVMVNGRIAREMSADSFGRYEAAALLGCTAARKESEAPVVIERRAIRCHRSVAHGDKYRHPPTNSTQLYTLECDAARAPLHDRRENSSPYESAGVTGHRSNRQRTRARVFDPVASNLQRAAYIAGTFDTKGRELFFLKQCIDKLGLRTVTVDLSTSGATSTANVHPREVARHHPTGERAVFPGDRGSSVSNMAIAFDDSCSGGVISAALCRPAAREEPRWRHRQCARYPSECQR